MVAPARSRPRLRGPRSSRSPIGRASAEADARRSLWARMSGNSQRSDRRWLSAADRSGRLTGRAFTERPERAKICSTRQHCRARGYADAPSSDRHRWLRRCSPSAANCRRGSRTCSAARSDRASGSASGANLPAPISSALAPVPGPDIARQSKWKRHDNQEEDLGIAARACLSWRDDIASPFLIVVARRSRACFDGRT